MHSICAALGCQQPHARDNRAPMPGITMAPVQHAGIYLGESHVGKSIHGKRGLRARLPLLLPL